MRLYFQDSKGELRLIGEFEIESDCFKEIDKFLDERNYKSYYKRMWVGENDIKYIDVGSWSEKFEIHGGEN